MRAVPLKRRGLARSRDFEEWQNCYYKQPRTAFLRFPKPGLPSFMVYYLRLRLAYGHRHWSPRHLHILAKPCRSVCLFVCLSDCLSLFLGLCLLLSRCETEVACYGGLLRSVSYPSFSSLSYSVLTLPSRRLLHSPLPPIRVPTPRLALLPTFPSTLLYLPLPISSSPVYLFSTSSCSSSSSFPPLFPFHAPPLPLPGPPLPFSPFFLPLFRVFILLLLIHLLRRKCRWRRLRRRKNSADHGQVMTILCNVAYLLRPCVAGCVRNDDLAVALFCIIL